jgi:hypothetical protein
MTLIQILRIVLAVYLLIVIICVEKNLKSAGSPKNKNRAKKFNQHPLLQVCCL